MGLRWINPPVETTPRLGWLRYGVQEGIYHTEQASADNEPLPPAPLEAQGPLDLSHEEWSLAVARVRETGLALRWERTGFDEASYISGAVAVMAALLGTDHVPLSWMWLPQIGRSVLGSREEARDGS